MGELDKTLPSHFRVVKRTSAIYHGQRKHSGREGYMFSCIANSEIDSNKHMVVFIPANFEDWSCTQTTRASEYYSYTADKVSEECKNEILLKLRSKDGIGAPESENCAAEVKLYMY